MSVILVPVDFSDATDDVVGRAAWLARATGASLVLVHVQEPEPGFRRVSADTAEVAANLARRAARVAEALDRVAAPAREAGVAHSSVQLHGDPVEEIVKLANEREAVVIVVGNHSRGTVMRALIGSVSQGILHEAPCPVLVVPEAGGG